MQVKELLGCILEDETINLISYDEYFFKGGECINLNDIDDKTFWDNIAHKRIRNLIPDGYNHILVVYEV